MRVANTADLSQTGGLGVYTARGGGAVNGGRNGPMSFPGAGGNMWESSPNMWESTSGETDLFGLGELNQEEANMLVGMSDLGQTGARGSGHHQGGRSGPPSLVYGNQDLFGFGAARPYFRDPRVHGLGRMMMPGSDGAPQSGGGVFGLGENLFGLGQAGPVIEPKTAKAVRNIGNFAAAAGGATFAFLAIKKGGDQASNIALGALGGGLALMALLSLGMTFGAVNLD
jgi:hypothetical protein